MVKRDGYYWIHESGDQPEIALYFAKEGSYLVYDGFGGLGDMDIYSVRSGRLTPPSEMPKRKLAKPSTLQ